MRSAPKASCRPGDEPGAAPRGGGGHAYSKVPPGEASPSKWPENVQRRAIDPIGHREIDWPNDVAARHQVLRDWHAVAVRRTQPYKNLDRLLGSFWRFWNLTDYVGQLWPSAKLLAACAGVEAKTVYRHIEDLESLGVIRTASTWRDGHKVKVIYLTWPADVAEADFEGPLFQTGSWRRYKPADNVDTGCPNGSEAEKQDNVDTGCPDNVDTGCPNGSEAEKQDNVDTGCPDNVDTGCPNGSEAEKQDNVDTGCPDNVDTGCPNGSEAEKQDNVDTGCPDNVDTGGPPNVEGNVEGGASGPVASCASSNAVDNLSGSGTLGASAAAESESLYNPDYAVLYGFASEQEEISALDAEFRRQKIRVRTEGDYQALDAWYREHVEMIQEFWLAMEEDDHDDAA